VPGIEPTPILAEASAREETPASRAPIDAMSYASVPAATATVSEPKPIREVAINIDVAPPVETATAPEIAPANEPAIEAIVPTPEPVAAPAVAPVAVPLSVIAQIEKALEDGRVDNLHDLLAFEPKDDAERFAQRFYEAEYHALCNRPLPAIDVLTKLDTPSLSDEQRQRVWFKIAVCQRSMNNFAGANDTLRRLVAAFPGRADYERLERRNYEQFVGDQATDVPILQKTTSLD